MTGRRIVVAAATLCAAALCAREGPAQSADARDAVASKSSERVLQSFTRCRDIVTPDARLDCFDKAAASLEAAVKAKDVRIVDRQDIRTARRSLFGFTLPRIALFGGGDGDAADRKEEAAFTQIETTIVSARQIENNRVELRLAEGDAVWRTTDPMSFPPRAGKKIRIRAGALGNYFLNIEGERTVRGMRVR